MEVARRWAGAGVGLVLLSLLFPGAAGAPPRAGEEFLKVGSLTFEGNDHFSGHQLRKWIRTQVPSFPLHPFRRSYYRPDFTDRETPFRDVRDFTS